MSGNRTVNLPMERGSLTVGMNLFSVSEATLYVSYSSVSIILIFPLSLSNR
jgi:hypothetical protein